MIEVLGVDIINGLDYGIQTLRDTLAKVTNSSSDYKAAPAITAQIVAAYEAKNKIVWSKTYTISEVKNEDQAAQP